MPTQNADSSDNPGTELSVDSLRPSKTGWAPYLQPLSEWKQGDVITGIPVSWVGPSGLDPFTGLQGGDDEDVVMPEGTIDALVCSQTCDLGGGPPGDKHPFAQIAPLVTAAGIANDDIGPARKSKHGYLIPVPRPDLGEDAPEYFADLRVLISISKALMIARTPVSCLDEAAALAMSERLAEKFRRAALSEVLSEKLPAALEKFIRTTGMNQQCFVKTEQVRLVVREGTRLKPTVVQLLILTTVDLNGPEIDQWVGTHRKIQQLLSQESIKCEPPIVITATKLDAVTYRESIPIRASALGIRAWP